MKNSKAENAQNSMKAKTRDIRELFRRQEEDDQIAENTTADGQGDAQHDDPPAEHPAVTGDDQGDAHQGDAQHAHYGELEEVELTNWEEKFIQYREETVRLEKEKEERISRAEKQEESWKLLRECISYINEN